MKTRKLTHHQKQLVLYSKLHFQKTNLYTDIKQLAAAQYALDLEHISPISIYNFVIDTYVKLINLEYIRFEVGDFLGRLFDRTSETIDYIKMIEKMLGEISIVKAQGLDLGEPDFSLLPPKKVSHV